MDLNLILQPISPETPCGVDVQSESVIGDYGQLRDIRFEARAIEKSYVEDNQQAQTRELWQKVFNISSDILRTRSKNLQVVAWLIEALIRLQGFKGLASGFMLARQLVDMYWDHLYPLPEEQDENEIDNRVASLAGLSGDETEGTLIFPILNTEITQAKSGLSYTTWQYQKALEIDRISDLEKKREKIDAGGVVSLEDFNASVKETAPEFFGEIYLDIKLSLQELKLLDDVLSEKCKEQSPSFSRINQSLTLCLDALMYFAKDYITPSLNETIGAEQEANASESHQKGQQLTSREESFQILLNVADFFAKSEPHSPLPYLIKKAVRWGKMPLPDLLSEIVEDENNLNTIFRLAGMEVKQ